VLHLHPHQSTAERQGEGAALPLPPVIVGYGNSFCDLLDLQALSCAHPLRSALLDELVHLRLVVMVVRQGSVDLGGSQMREGSQNILYRLAGLNAFNEVTDGNAGATYTGLAPTDSGPANDIRMSLGCLLDEGVVILIADQ